MKVNAKVTTVRIKVVGPCASGKSELVSRLRAAGYEAYDCAQEHPYVPDLWQRMNPPHVLVYLDAHLDTLARRRPRSDWSPELLAEQHRRLAHARAHCDLYLATDHLTLIQVFEYVRAFLERRIVDLP